MLRDVLETARLPKETCAQLLGVDAELFSQWVSGQREVPHSIASVLSTVLGVHPDVLATQRDRGRTSDADTAPAIWFKLRGDERIGAQDREWVFLVRHLAHNVEQLERAVGAPKRVWETVFERVLRSVDWQLPPREQGRRAATAFRELQGLGSGATGIGEVLRGNMRSLGILVVEAPLRASRLEGCAFPVIAAGSERPCIFANSYQSQWFRRNAILLHELAHLIFDPYDAVALDFVDGSGTASLGEERAQAFAQEALVPGRVLRHIAQRHGVSFVDLDAAGLATLVAETHAEQRMVITAAREAGLVSDEVATKCDGLDIAAELRARSEHALASWEYFRKYPELKEVGDRRWTTIPSRRMRLPVGFVKHVLDAVATSEISPSKAAELLMMDRRIFDERFGFAAELD